MAKVIDQVESGLMFLLFLLALVLLWLFVIVPLWNSGDWLKDQNQGTPPSGLPFGLTPSNFPQTSAQVAQHPIASLIDPEAVGLRAFIEWLFGGSSNSQQGAAPGGSQDFTTYNPANPAPWFLQNPGGFVTQ